MRLYLHANQINPALSATLSGLKEAINTQEQKEAPEKNMSNSGAVLPLIEGYVLCMRPEEKFLPLQCSNSCACKPQSGQLWSVSCYFLPRSDTALLWHPVSSHVRYNSLPRVPAFVVQVHCLLCHGVTPSSPSAREHRAVWKWKCLSLLSLLPPLSISIVTRKKIQHYTALMGKGFSKKHS